MKTKRQLSYMLAASVLVLSAIGSQTIHANNSTGPVTKNLVEANINDGFSALVNTTRPAVVSIIVKGQQKPVMNSSLNNGQQPPNAQQFFKRFFGEDYQMQQRALPQQQRGTKAVGSGFIIDPSGLVVTNYHVVKDAKTIEILLSDGTEIEATLQGADPKTDLALLKISDEKTYPYVKFGDSTTADVGDWVVAMGNPFGLGGTTTKGIISARGRSLGSGPLDDFIQTDAPINRGNSGGPLFNLKGEVIGVNSAIYSPNGGSVGIGFAIPSSMAEHVIAQIKDTGSVKRGFMGVNIQAVDEDIAASLGLDNAKGALVSQVSANSPAAAAKIQSGDVILAFDGKSVDKMRDLPKLVAKAKIGEAVDVKIWRNEAEKVLKITVGKGSDGMVLSSAEGASNTEKLGLKLSKLEDKTKQGVLVSGITAGSVAADQGIASGEIIKKAGSKAVSDPSDIELAIAQASKKQRGAVLLLLQKGDQSRYIALPIEALKG